MHIVKMKICIRVINDVYDTIFYVMNLKQTRVYHNDNYFWKTDSN